MQNIKHTIGPDNVGGIALFYFIPVEDVLYIPGRTAEGITEKILLKEGATWYSFQTSKETLSFKEPESIGRAGRLYRQELKGYIAKDTPAIQEALSLLKGRKFILLYSDHNNRHPKLVGTKQYYLQFESELDTRTAAAGGTGRSFSFKGESALEACFYKGEFPVNNTVVVPPNSGLPVTIRKGNGDVIAVVEPGGIFEIFSGFSFGFRILGN